VLDLDATDSPLHGHQEGRFFHGYNDCYCYLPLYVFAGRPLLAAKLRRANIDATAGAHQRCAGDRRRAVHGCVTAPQSKRVASPLPSEMV
jgi:hypothetical protein